MTEPGKCHVQVVQIVLGATVPLERRLALLCNGSEQERLLVAIHNGAT